MRKILAFILFMICASGCALAEEESWMIFSSRTESMYTDASAAYTHPVYTGEAVESAVSLTLGLGDAAEAVVTAPEDGLYEIWLSYRNTTQSALPTEMTVTIDGQLPFYELRRVKLNSLWVDDGVFPLDRYGNEMAATPYAQDVVQQAGMQDSAGRTSEPFLFQLTAGEHVIGFSVQEGAVEISGVSLRAPRQIPAYQAGDASGNALITLEAERMASRSSSSIRGAGSFEATLTPYDGEERKINYLDGVSFHEAGDTVTYSLTVEETGWYHLGFYYKQNARVNFPVFVDVLLDSALPSEAARAVPFAYRTSYDFTDATYQGQAQTFYLEQGEHTLSLRINNTAVTPVYTLIDRLLSEINGLSLEIIRLTGGVTTDRYRDYDLLTYIPNLVELLAGWSKDCSDMVERMRQLSPSGDGSLFSNLSLSADQLLRLSKDPEDLPRRLTELSSGSNSVARMLAQQLQDIAENDLHIDQIYLYQSGAQLPSKPGMLEKTWLGAQRFVTSFGQQDYAVGNGEQGHLQVWMGRSRQYVEALQNLIDTHFTPETGIAVDLSIMPDTNKLVLSNAAGTAPDVALSLQYVVPSYLNIRGALYDLTQFEDYGEIVQRFPADLCIPYILDDGVFAMPETVNFWVLFYRTDILEALSIDVPDTLEAVKLILPELQRRNMNFYFPTAGLSGMKTFPTTLPLIWQHGGSVYGDTIDVTLLDSEISLKGFRELTELFTVYNLPTEVPSPGFYQSFRDGTLPIGVADIQTYNLLLNAAPELDGLWDIALFPGVEDESGEVQRWISGAADTMAILADTDMPQESWTFLKWWSSAEVQSEYANLIQSTYGEEYIWPTANIEAFAELPLKSSHKAVVLEQMNWMTAPVWTIGTYMVERELSNAFIAAVVDGTDARRALDTAIKRINRENYRKLEEFGYYKDGEMIREFVTPDGSVIDRLIEQGRQKEADAQ